MPRIIRKQTPPAFRNYKKYKPYLRLDFQACCAYCRIPELRYGPPRNFTVDHFRPKSHPEFRHLISEYSNLYYVCQDCNAAKGSAWPTPEMITFGYRFLDPCDDDFYYHWMIRPDGSLKPQSDPGEYMVARVRLNRPYLRVWRKSKTQLVEQIADVTAMLGWTRPGTPERETAAKLLTRLQTELAAEFGHLS
jgi:hypothetical protein